MTITINDVTFDKVTEFSAARETRRTDIHYNTQGDMLIDLVNRKYHLKVLFGLLTENEMKKLREFTKEIFVKVKFNAPEGEVTEDFHIAEEPAPEVTTINGVAMYAGVQLELLQK